MGTAHGKKVKPMNNLKPGGGNKLQPYISAGNGKKSGEYTNRTKIYNASSKFNVDSELLVKNVQGKYNFKNSQLVRSVKRIFITRKGHTIKIVSVPNSVTKKIINGVVITERYYNNKGIAYLDIDYTDHNNRNAHPFGPHIHRWQSSSNGVLYRCKGEKIK